MRFPYSGTKTQTPAERWQTRQQVTDFVRQRGTEKRPNPPRSIIPQAAPRAVQITWGLPPGDASDIAGWRVYSGTESNLVGKISDRGTRQYLVPATAGQSINIFVSSVNALGVESTKVQVQASAITEAGAPSLPTVPSGFTEGLGSDISSGIGTRTAASGNNFRNL